MANFDVAVGITQAGINNTLQSFFKNPTAQTKIFNQHISKQVGGIEASVDFSILDSPKLVLAPPSQEKWLASRGIDGKLETGSPPQSNIFQVNVAQVKVSGTISGVTVSSTGEIDVYGSFSLVDNVLKVLGISVWIDESKWKNNGFTKLIVNAIIIPHALKTINNLLNAIPFPQIPSTYTTTGFKNPIMDIVNDNEIVIATSLASSPDINLDSYVPPVNKDIYLQADLELINSVLAKELDNYKFDENSSNDDKKAKSSAEIKGTVKSVRANIIGNSTYANLNITDLSGYGELSGLGATIAKTILCPIGTAIDAASNPKSWDKIVSSFNISYKPNPLSVPVSLKVSPSESVEVSLGEIESIQIIASPKWSGVVGSILATAVAAFGDLLSAIFKGKIINKIIKGKVQNLEVYKRAAITKQLDGVNVTLVGEVGAALIPQDNDLVVEGFTISFA